MTVPDGTRFVPLQQHFYDSFGSFPGTSIDVDNDDDESNADAEADTSRQSHSPSPTSSASSGTTSMQQSEGDRSIARSDSAGCHGDEHGLPPPQSAPTLPLLRIALSRLLHALAHSRKQSQRAIGAVQNIQVC